MAEVESYLLQRQPQVLESLRLGRAARRARLFVYAAGLLLLLAAIDFTRGHHSFGIFFAMFGLWSAVWSWWLRRKIKTAPAADNSQASTMEAVFPTSEALRTRTSERDLAMLGEASPRRVKLSPQREYFRAAVNLGFLVYCLLVAFRLASAGYLWGSTALFALAGLMVLDSWGTIAWLSILWRKEPRRLLARGRATLGLLVITIDEGTLWFQRTVVWYDFRDAAGQIRSGSSHCPPSTHSSDNDYRKRPGPGTTVVVFYDPNCPEKQIAYRCSPVEIVFPGSGGRAGSHS